MAYGVRVRVWGDWACFTRPEMKMERVSYDVITPSAARGVLEAIFWKPEIRWVVDRIHVLKPIRFGNVRRNEVGSKIPTKNIQQAISGRKSFPIFLNAADDRVRVQRATMALRNVEYVIEAHFEFTGKVSDGAEGKYLDCFNRRLAKGQCYHHPYLGCREFPAFFAPIEGVVPKSPLEGKCDLGWMLLDIDYAGKKPMPRFFKPEMKNGIITVQNVIPPEATR